MKVLCSTGGIIGPQNQRNYRLLEAYSKELSCDGFELMMYKAWYEELDDLIAYLNDLQLYIPVVHCEKNIGSAIGAGTAEEIERGLAYFKADCKVAKEISAQKLVFCLPGWIEKQYMKNSIWWWNNHYLPGIKEQEFLYLTTEDMEEFIIYSVSKTGEELKEINFVNAT